MDDKDILEKLEKYEKKELEIDSNYNIKKEELEKEYKKQHIDNKYELLNFLSQKQEEAKKRYEVISLIRNALFRNDENEGMKEFNNMAKETNAIFENDNINQGIQLRETEINGMKKTNFIEEIEGKEAKEGKEEEDEIESKEKKDLQMNNKKRNRPF
jgi:hypothetical protein